MMAEALVWSEKRAVSIDTLNTSYCRSQHAPAVLARVACSRPALPLRTHDSSSQRPLPVAKAPSQALPPHPCARQTRTQQGRAYRGEDGGSRHRRDRLQEGGAGGAYGHRSPCAFKQHLRSEEHTSELQSRLHLVCRLLLEKKNTTKTKKKGNNTSKTIN